MNETTKITDFVGMMSSDGEISILNATNGQVVLNIDMTGTMTLYGPDEAVLRSYADNEIEERQKELDAEFESVYDEAYGKGFGRAVMYAFTLVAEELAKLALSGGLKESKAPTLN